jgi:histidyl-tRNA synthetase
MDRPQPRNYKGFRDVFPADLLAKRQMIDAVRKVYESYGFVPLETPALEYVDVLGKFLPESNEVSGGIFSFKNADLAAPRPDDPDLWLGMRYDLTAPLARVVAQYPELAHPFRRYQLGTVWRYEKPGPGRFREFTQLDFDSVGVESVDADAEACMVICDAFEALGFSRGEYTVKVNNRKVLQGVLEACGLSDVDVSREDSQAGVALRAIDKLDRLGLDGVTQLLGAGRKDESGHFAPGAQLQPAQIERIVSYLSAQGASRAAVCDALAELLGGEGIGAQGVAELRQIDALLARLGFSEDQVCFDPTVVRGLGYYTGPVFEGVLTREILDEDGQLRQFGSVFGGGRYDNLVERFTGERVPATGASVGVDRLLEAVKLLREGTLHSSTADVLITVMEQARLGDYFALARKLRAAGINAELYLAGGGFRKQLKYADKLDVPLAIIIGSNEFEAGTATIKNLRLGAELAGQITDRDAWRKGQPAQVEVKMSELVPKLTEMLGW